MRLREGMEGPDGVSGDDCVGVFVRTIFLSCSIDGPEGPGFCEDMA